jgi:hypothetical protein
MLRTRVRAGPVAGLVISLVFAAVFSVIGLGELWFPGAAPSLDQATPVTLRVPYGTRIIVDGRRGGSRLSYEHARIIVPRGTLLSRVERRAPRRLRLRVDPPPPDRREPPAQLLRDLLHRLDVAHRVPAQFRPKSRAPAARAGGRVRAHRGRAALRQADPALHRAARVLDADGGAARCGSRSPSIGAPRSSWRSAVAFVAASLLRFDLVLLCVLLVRGIARPLFLNKRNPRSHALRGRAGGARRGRRLHRAHHGVRGALRRARRSDARASVATSSRASAAACMAGVLARMLRDPAERVMGHVSRDKLLDLTDLEQPLLQDAWLREAPGAGSTRAPWPTSPKPLRPPSARTPSSRASAPTTTTSARRFSRSTSSRTSATARPHPTRSSTPRCPPTRSWRTS